MSEKYLYKISGKISIKHYREDNDWHASKVGRFIKDLDIKGDLESEDTLFKNKGARRNTKTFVYTHLKYFLHRSTCVNVVT